MAKIDHVGILLRVNCVIQTRNYSDKLVQNTGRKPICGFRVEIDILFQSARIEITTLAFDVERLEKFEKNLFSRIYYETENLKIEQYDILQPWGTLGICHECKAQNEDDG